MLSHKDIDDKINSLFIKHKDLVLVYKELENENKKDKEYDSFFDELKELFIYSLVKNKADLEQFSNVMSYLYQTSTKSELGRALNNFFVPDDPNISLRDYSKLDKNNNDETISDNMAYLFLDFKEENISGKRLVLDKNNLPYLLAILNEVEDNTIETLWYGGYQRFIGNFRYDIEPIGSLIKMAEANTAFNKREEGNYLNFFDILFREIGNLSYENEVYPNQYKETYKLLSKYIKNVDNVIADSLVRVEKNDNKNELKTDLGLINFCLKVGEIDIVSMIDKKFRKIYLEEKANLSGSEYEQKSTIQKLLTKISSTIDVSFKKYDFKMDCSKINLKKKYQENFIYLKLIERKIKNNQDLSLDKNVAEYIINLFKKPKKTNVLDNFFGIGSTLSEETIVPYVKAHINYQELDASLDKKATQKIKKSKI